MVTGDGRAEDVAGHSRELRKKVKKKPEIRAAAFFIISLSHGVAADGDRNRQSSLPISGLLTASGITTAGASFWCLESYRSRNVI